MSQAALMAARASGSVRKPPPPPQRESSSSSAANNQDGDGGGGGGGGGAAEGIELTPTVRQTRQMQHHSGNWNVEVVRGKVTTRCFWNACKAFSFGVALMVIGTSMAVVGYYADQLSIGQETRGNQTVPVKNESRGFHLNNLSYAGPIIMGCGGFIVVAACVMTFEARDSAAKVVPARPKYSGAVPAEGAAAAAAGPAPGAPGAPGPARSPGSTRRQSARRSAGSQTRGSSRRNQESQYNADPNRRALTAAFVQFSRSLQRTACTPLGGGLPPGALAGALAGAGLAVGAAADLGAPGTGSPPIKRSPSAPDLMGAVAAARKASQILAAGRRAAGSRREGGVAGVGATTGASGVRGRANLRPYAALHRQALSVDCQDLGMGGLGGLGGLAPHGIGSYSPPGLFLSRQHSGQSGISSRGSRDSMELGASACGASVAGSNRGSQASMVMDLHLPNDWPVTLRVRDQSQAGGGAGHGPGAAGAGPAPPGSCGHGHGPPRRSDTARRHMLTRQRPVGEEVDQQKAGAKAGRGGAHNPRRFAGGDQADGHWARWFTETTETCSAGAGSGTACTAWQREAGAVRSLEGAAGLDSSPAVSPAGSPRASPRGGSPRGGPHAAPPAQPAQPGRSRMARHTSVDVHMRSPAQSPPRSPTRPSVRRAASPASRLADGRSVSPSPRLVRYADEDALGPCQRTRADSGGAATFRHGRGAGGAAGGHRKLRACRSTAEECTAVAAASPSHGYTSVPSVSCACAAYSCACATACTSRCPAACADCQGLGEGRQGQPRGSRRQSSKSSANGSRHGSAQGSRRTSRQNSATQEAPSAPAASSRSASKSPAPKTRSTVIDMAQVEAQLRNQQDELHRALEAHKRRREERLQQMLQQPAGDQAGACAAPPPPPPAAAAADPTPTAHHDGVAAAAAADTAPIAPAPSSATCKVDLDPEQTTA